MAAQNTHFAAPSPIAFPFREIIRAQSEIAAVAWAAIAFADRGKTVYMVDREVDGQKIRNHVLRKSTDGGATFGMPVEISNARLASALVPLVGLMVALGALNRFSTKPALARSASSATAEPRAAKAYLPIGWEGALGMSVLVVTGFLTTLPPGVHSATI